MIPLIAGYVLGSSNGFGGPGDGDFEKIEAYIPVLPPFNAMLIQRNILKCTNKVLTFMQ